LITLVEATRAIEERCEGQFGAVELRKIYTDALNVFANMMTDEVASIVVEKSTRRFGIEVLRLASSDFALTT
jgi:hypothetical protein